MDVKTTVLACMVSLFVSTSHARTIHVPNDYSTIHEGVDAAIHGDSVVVAKGTYNPDWARIDQNIFLIGESRDETVVIAIGEIYTVFYTLDQCTSFISGFTIEGGSYSLAVNSESSVTAENIIIVNTFGGAINVDQGSSLTLNHGIVQNIAKEGLVINGVTTLSDVDFRDGKTGIVFSWFGSLTNSSDVTVTGQRTSGIQMNEVYPPDSLNLVGFDINNNPGNGVGLTTHTFLSMQNSRIADNGGSGFVIIGSRAITVNQCEIFGNKRFDVEVQSTAQRLLDFQSNWWGEETTAEMERLGYPANISTIWDGHDNPSLSFVDYSNWERRTGVGGSSPPIPRRTVHLLQNAPNPFNPLTTIAFDLPFDVKNAILSVFDLSGRVVLEPFHGHLPAGHHAVQVNADQLPSGVYFYGLTTDQDQSTPRRMVVLK